jgi:hypothetical protein
MSKPENIKLDNVEYVRKDSIQQETVEFTGEATIASRMIGRKVLVRSRNEGINCGEVVLADETGVELKDCRRLWYHKPKDSSVAWYEGVAISGLSSDSKVSCTVPRKVIIEDYSMTACTSEAYENIMTTQPYES